MQKLESAEADTESYTRKLKANDTRAFHFDNGYFHFLGDASGGVLAGHGTLFLSDGGSVEGSFDQGEVNGFGTRRWEDGSVYVGEFSRGEFHGHGRTINASTGEEYEGGFQWGKRSGQGRLNHTQRGLLYEGEFFNHKIHGEGMLQERVVQLGHGAPPPSLGTLQGLDQPNLTPGFMLTKGCFKEGLPHGHHCRRQYPNGEIIIGNAHEGVWSSSRIVCRVKDGGAAIRSPRQLSSKSSSPSIHSECTAPFDGVIEFRNDLFPLPPCTLSTQPQGLGNKAVLTTSHQLSSTQSLSSTRQGLGTRTPPLLELVDDEKELVDDTSHLTHPDPPSVLTYEGPIENSKRTHFPSNLKTPTLTQSFTTHNASRSTTPGTSLTSFPLGNTDIAKSALHLKDTHGSKHSFTSKGSFSISKPLNRATDGFVSVMLHRAFDIETNLQREVITQEVKLGKGATNALGKMNKTLRAVQAFGGSLKVNKTELEDCHFESGRQVTLQLFRLRGMEGNPGKPLFDSTVPVPIAKPNVTTTDIAEALKVVRGGRSPTTLTPAQKSLKPRSKGRRPSAQPEEALAPDLHHKLLMEIPHTFDRVAYTVKDRVSFHNLIPLVTEPCDLIVLLRAHTLPLPTAAGGGIRTTPGETFSPTPSEPACRGLSASGASRRLKDSDPLGLVRSPRNDLSHRPQSTASKCSTEASRDSLATNQMSRSAVGCDVVPLGRPLESYQALHLVRQC